MGVLNGIRIALMVASTALLVSGLILTVVAAVFPGWHIVEITEYKQVHQHGLWMYCIKGSQLGGAKDDWNCDLKEATMDDENTGFDEKQHVFHGWNRTVVILLAAAFIMAVLSLLVSFCGFCNKWFTIGWSAGSILALVFQAAAVIVFFINGHDYENLRIIGQKGTYTQEKGYAFWCAVAAVGAYLLNFILTVAVSILSFVNDKRQSIHHKTWPKHHTAV